MGKTGKWIKNFLTGKKDNKLKEKKETIKTDRNPSPTKTPPISIAVPTSKDKKRWSFRRSSATAPAAASKENQYHPVSFSVTDPVAATTTTTARKHAVQVQVVVSDNDDDEKHVSRKHVVAETVTAGNDDDDDEDEEDNDDVAAAKASAIEDAAAIKIQSVFRSYLARKALCALKGLVKLQALVRGHLVRKQATATLRCMQALVTVQARARAQRLHKGDYLGNPPNHRQSTHRRSTQENQYRNTYNDIGMEENIKIVEMDMGESMGTTKNRNSYSNHSQTEDHRFSTYQTSNSKQDNYYYQVSPSPSVITDRSPKAHSGRFEDYSFSTAQSSPQCNSVVISKHDTSKVPFEFSHPDYEETMSYDYPLYPNYMSNTQSSRAKARSQSAPKQRPPEAYERQPSRRKISMEGRNIPRAMRMQRSSSHVGATAQNYQYPWSVKLDRSTVSLIQSECGSTSTVLTNTNYCKSHAGYDPERNRY